MTQNRHSTGARQHSSLAFQVIPPSHPPSRGVVCSTNP